MQKIGVYGGTFDPVHCAHLILARDALEKFQLEKIIFIPAAVSPDKAPPIASPDARFEMLQAAIVGEPKFSADACELRRPPPSYTIDTVQHLRKQIPDAEIFLLVGDDNLVGLPKWRRFEELRESVRFVILRRAEEPIPHSYLKIERQIEISATEIRKRVASAQSIRYFVPQAVEAMVTNLYRREA